jgi:hypothetical protein
MNGWMGCWRKGKVEDCWLALGCQRMRKAGQAGPEIAAQKRAATSANEQRGKIGLKGGADAYWSANPLVATWTNSSESRAEG